MAKKKRAPGRVKGKKTKAGKVKSTAKKTVKKTRPAVKKSGKNKAVKVKAIKKKSIELGLEKIGEVTHYFPHVNAAAVLLLKDGLKIGDHIYIKGHTTDFKETVHSIQLDRAAIEEGSKGQEIGLLVKSRVRIGDSVYRV